LKNGVFGVDGLHSLGKTTKETRSNNGLEFVVGGGDTCFWDTKFVALVPFVYVGGFGLDDHKVAILNDHDRTTGDTL